MAEQRWETTYLPSRGANLCLLDIVVALAMARGKDELVPDLITLAV
jgi:hypothetical protein